MSDTISPDVLLSDSIVRHGTKAPNSTTLDISEHTYTIERIPIHHELTLHLITDTAVNVPYLSYGELINFVFDPAYPTDANVYNDNLNIPFYKQSITYITARIHLIKDMLVCGVIDYNHTNYELLLLSLSDAHKLLQAEHQQTVSHCITQAIELCTQPDMKCLHKMLHDLCAQFTFDHTQIAHRCKVSIRKMSQWYFSTDGRTHRFDSEEQRRLTMYVLQHVQPNTKSLDDDDYTKVVK